MSVFHQMGHDSSNLLNEEYLNMYKGAIISPVNCTKEKLTTILEGKTGKLDEYIFDPQLYYPESELEKLKAWDYFPSDFSSSDLGNISYWKNIIKNIDNSLKYLKIDSICTPMIVPRIFNDDYYNFGNKIYKICKDIITSNNLLHTIIIDVKSLTKDNEVERIASIITKHAIKKIYLIAVTHRAPRFETKDYEEIKALLKFIKILASSGIKILMGYCSSEIVITKFAGLHDCATGKFFNLRRFTPGRWEIPSKGGGQIPYWFEENLLAFLRSADLDRIKNIKLLSDSSLENPYGVEILRIREEHPDNPWLKYSWRQWLHWFGVIENKLSTERKLAFKLLQNAEENWKALDEQDIFMDERTNDGSWIKPWKRAIEKI